MCLPDLQSLLSIAPLGTNFSEIFLSKCKTFHSRKCIWKRSLRNGSYFSMGGWVKVGIMETIKKENDKSLSLIHPGFLPAVGYKSIFIVAFVKWIYWSFRNSNIYIVTQRALLYKYCYYYCYILLSIFSSSCFYHCRYFSFDSSISVVFESSFRFYSACLLQEWIIRRFTANCFISFSNSKRCHKNFHFNEKKYQRHRK